MNDQQIGFGRPKGKKNLKASVENNNKIIRNQFLLRGQTNWKLENFRLINVIISFKVAKLAGEEDQKHTAQISLEKFKQKKYLLVQFG